MPLAQDGDAGGGGSCGLVDDWFGGSEKFSVLLEID
jgi:hypothetical protein